MKKTITLTVALLFTTFLYSQTVATPFQKLGYDVFVGTSSKGEYAEFHDLTDVVEIGSVLYNTKTKEIVQLLDEGKSTLALSSATTAMSIDPHCERYYWISPYAYAANNPIRMIDPDGKDIYRFDDKTGEFHLAVKNDDKFDQIGKFKQNKETGEYTLATNKKGEARTRMDNIEKGILSDGINFKENDNVIAVGGENQPSESGVENFVVELGEMVNKEIGGYYLSEKGQNTADRMYISKYKNNTQTKSYSSFNYKTAGASSVDDIVFQAHFHTHPSGIPGTDPTKPSGGRGVRGDIEAKDSFRGVKKFFILTRGHSPIPY